VLPSVVATIRPEMPATVQTAVVGQEMPYRVVVSEVLWGVQVVPPLAVVRIVPPSPTATQANAVAQDTPFKYVPESLFRRTQPPRGVGVGVAVFMGVADGAKVPVLVGAGGVLVGVFVTVGVGVTGGTLPMSRIVPESPDAKQVVGPGQAMLCNATEVPLDCGAQTTPPLVVVRMRP
jgi:hypothetical protein